MRSAAWFVVLGLSVACASSGEIRAGIGDGLEPERHEYEEGPLVRVHDNGLPAEMTTYVRGQLTGPRLRWNASGEVIESGYYYRGTPLGPFYRYERGKAELVEEYHDGGDYFGWLHVPGRMEPRDASWGPHTDPALRQRAFTYAGPDAKDCGQRSRGWDPDGMSGCVDAALASGRSFVAQISQVDCDESCCGRAFRRDNLLFAGRDGGDVLVVGYGFGGDVRGRAPEYTRYIFAGEKVVSKICRQPERAEDGTYRCADGSEMWLPGRSRADFY